MTPKYYFRVNLQIWEKFIENSCEILKKKISFRGAIICFLPEGDFFSGELFE